MTVKASFRSGLQITDTESPTGGAASVFPTRPTAFQYDLNTDEIKGPSPGLLTIPTGGKAVSFEELVCPGPCRIHNLSKTAGDFIELGLWDPVADKFYPLIEVQAGHFNEITLSRNLLERYEGTGTGTSSTFLKFFAKATGTADQKILIEGFDDPR